MGRGGCAERVGAYPACTDDELAGAVDGAGLNLALVDPAAHENRWRTNPDHVYFAVPNLEEVLGRDEELGCRDSMDRTDRGIDERPLGERRFYVGDPFGNAPYFADDQTLFTGSGQAERAI